MKADANQPVSGGWAATYGGFNYDWATSIQQTSDGGYIVAGYLSSYFVSSFGSGVGGLWVLKLSPAGTVEWQKAYGGVGAESIQQTSDGGFIVAGVTESFGAGKSDLWVLKLKPDGSIRPSCNLIIRDTKTSGINSNAIPLDTSASVKDSSANPQVPWVKVRATNASADILCP